MARTRWCDRPRNKDENHSSSTAAVGWDDGWEVSANNEDIQNSLGAIRNVRQMLNEDDREHGPLLCFLISVALSYHDLRFLWTIPAVP